MGYRWYKGRLLSDDEYHDVIQSEQDANIGCIGLVASAIIGAIAGYSYAGKGGVIVGAIVGAVIGFKFAKSIGMLVGWALALFIVYLLFFR